MAKAALSPERRSWARLATGGGEVSPAIGSNNTKQGKKNKPSIIDKRLRPDSSTTLETYLFKARV